MVLKLQYVIVTKLKQLCGYPCPSLLVLLLPGSGWLTWVNFQYNGVLLCGVSCDRNQSGRGCMYGYDSYASDYHFTGDWESGLFFKAWKHYSMAWHCDIFNLNLISLKGGDSVPNNTVWMREMKSLVALLSRHILLDCALPISSSGGG